MRVDGINTFLLHVSQCITFHQTKLVTATLIAETSLKSFYSRLGFKIIKYFATSPNLEVSHKQFHYESVKSEALQRKTIGLQCYLTMPRRVKFYDNIIDLNKDKYVLKELNEFPPSYYWFSYEYINAEFKKKVDKTKEQLAVDGMERILNFTWNILITIPTS